MNCISKLLLAGICSCFLLLVNACGDTFAPKSVYKLNQESKDWMVVGEEGDSFIMVDSLGNIERVSLEGEYEFFGGSSSSSGFLGLDKEVVDYEIIKQNFSGDNGLSMSLDIKARDIFGSCELEIELNDLVLTYDPQNKRLERVLLWERIDESSGQGKSLDGALMLSRAFYFDSLEVDDSIYTDVIDFHFQDFHEMWTDTTVVEFAFAKGVGLLRYIQSNGEVYERQASQ